MRLLMLLLGLVLVRAAKGDETSPVEGLLQTVNKVLPVLRVIYDSVFGKINKASFRAALEMASDLVRAAFPPRPPPSVPERWWGERECQDTSIRPFRVDFSEQMITDLRGRIHRRRNITSALRSTANTYGSHSDFLARFLDTWADHYNFQEREDWLNSFTQYVTNIQGKTDFKNHLKKALKMRLLMLLLGLVLVRAAKGDETSPVEGLLQSVNKVLPVLRVIYDSVFGKINKASFRAALEMASDLVRAAFPPRPPPSVPERWWGERECQDTSIRPFRVDFSEQMITDLRGRIHRRRNITSALRGTANTYGSHSDFLARFLDTWADHYNFQEREDWLNSFTQYVTNIQGLDIHFIHMKPLNPRGKKVLPLLLLHGWPVTAFEYVKVIQYLLAERDDCDFVFEIIVPNLPGYGYSEATFKIGMAPYQMGIIMKNLMLRLGKPNFYIHAGDVGHVVGDAMAVLYPDMVLGLHSNFPFSARPETMTKWVLGQLYPPAVVEPAYENRLYPLIEHFQFYLENFGYFHVQASKPDNVGHGLDDSPVALVSWLLQNLMMATNHLAERAVDGTLPDNFDMRDWMDSITVSWVTRSMTTSVRSYAETLAVYQDPLSVGILKTPTAVPFAAIKFRHELIYQPDEFLQDKYPNLVHSTTLDFGGHFAGYQEPRVLADSIWTTVEKMELFHGSIDVELVHY